MKKALVCGAGGFIGSHLVKRLKNEGLWVRGVDLKSPEFAETQADDFVIGDLRDPQVCQNVVDRHFEEVYQLAADMEKYKKFPQAQFWHFKIPEKEREFRGSIFATCLR